MHRAVLVDGVSDPDSKARSRTRSQSVVYRLLVEPRRRAALSVLEAQTTPPVLEDLARAVAARETETDPQAVSSADVRRVAVSLHHTHLPKLAAHDVVVYDPATRPVEAAATVDDLVAELDEMVP